MIVLFMETTRNDTLLPIFVRALLKEYQFWMDPANSHVVKVQIDGTSYALNQYHANTTLPRPESYLEDVTLAESLGLNASASGLLFKNLASAAESGWDFSSRWFADELTLGTIRTTEIVPVELNSIMLRMEYNIASLLRLGEHH